MMGLRVKCGSQRQRRFLLIKPLDSKGRACYDNKKSNRKAVGSLVIKLTAYLPGGGFFFTKNMYK